MIILLIVPICFPTPKYALDIADIALVPNGCPLNSLDNRIFPVPADILAKAFQLQH
jgi:hypothetical protein